MGAPFGHEHSFKLVPGRLLDRRYLLSLHRDDLDASPRGRLHDIILPLNIPAETLAEVEGLYGAATLIHFGYEQGVEGEIIKLYLEFAETFEQQRQRVDTAQHALLVHTAFKWDPERPGRHTIAHYRCPPEEGLEGLMQRVAASYGGDRQGSPYRLVERLIDHCVPRRQGDAPMVLEVEESGNERRSFDINLYDCGVRLGDVAAEVVAMGEYLGVERGAIEQQLEQSGERVLGHLSGGIGRDGDHFFTLYYGVEEGSH